jgi:hypothetical protein
VLDGTFDLPADLDAVAVLEEHLAVGWEFDVDVLIDAPRDVVGRCLPRALGVLDAVDDETSRLTGTTGNPVWYAEQLVSIPAAYRIVGGPELRASARELGLRLLTAGGGRPPVGAADTVPADRPHPNGGPMDDTDALPSMGRPAAGALAAAGISTLSEVSERSERELLALHGVGPKAIRLLRAALADRGLALRGDA